MRLNVINQNLALGRYLLFLKLRTYSYIHTNIHIQLFNWLIRQVFFYHISEHYMVITDNLLFFFCRHFENALWYIEHVMTTLQDLMDLILSFSSPEIYVEKEVLSINDEFSERALSSPSIPTIVVSSFGNKFKFVYLFPVSRQSNVENRSIIFSGSWLEGTSLQYRHDILGN